MKPAQAIIEKIGGIDKAVEITGVHRTRVYAWQKEAERGGTGGIIPQKHHVAILNYARENGIELSADEFLPQSEAVN